MGWIGSRKKAGGVSDAAAAVVVCKGEMWMCDCQLGQLAVLGFVLGYQGRYSRVE